MRVLAFCAAVGWFWAFALLAIRDYQILVNSALSSTPPVWGFLALPAGKLIAILAAAAVLSGCAGYVAGQSKPRSLRPLIWLLLVYAIPLVDIARAAGAAIPFTFYEPLLLAALTGRAVLEIVRRWPSGQRNGANPSTPRWFAVTGLLTASAATWWYIQGCRAYDDFLLGYHDFGHFAYRVINTWQGRGFLLESPGTPAFWDHFNPGLALLAPLWGLWPDARLFVLLQALCLATPALLVFGIARAWGARSRAAAAWGVAYLAFPAVGQLNLNYSYGWHPVSVALPWMFLAAWLLLLRRYTPAVIAALLACSFKETVLVTLGCLAAAMAVLAWLNRVGRDRDNQQSSPEAKLAVLVPWQGWLVTWGLITATFFLVVHLTPFAQFQTSRFANLGDSSFEIAMSPLLRPRAFWGQILRSDSLVFVLALFVPLGFQTLRRGWLTLSALMLPMVVLLAWEHGPATSIAFQYVTTLIPILFLAAISGASRDQLAPATPQVTSAASIERGLLTAGVSAMVACLTASALFGALPWSSRTLVIMVARSYHAGDRDAGENPRAVGTPGNRHLMEIVNQVDRADYAVLASGRVAAHLLHVGRLEAVGQAIVRWDNLCDEAGQGRSGIEVFDWIVLDQYDVFQQSSEKMTFIADEARRVGYRVVSAEDGILVFARPALP